MSGGMAGYQQFAQAEMMMGAGEGMKKGGGGGGGALEGAGLGMGFAMAQNMANMNAQNAQRPAHVQAPVQQGTMNQVKCGSCGAMVNPGKFCAECGKTMAAAGPKFCPNCGKPVTGKFCADCGTAG
jgi:membrane protease subunit (stomatin/prohibitin family)